MILEQHPPTMEAFYTKKVWARGVPSRVKSHLRAMKKLELLHFSI
jgi:hypothetical protein